MTAAATALLVTPQTVSIAVGAALISVVSCRLMLLVMIVVIGACAAWLLARPARSPRERGEEVAITLDAGKSVGDSEEEEELLRHTA